ncbi:MAG: hypothetical protein A2283_21435 [Lentisphaerae bacterium RIFOXYA12_FULL_48_11]|nr:MAG: hypothetical protein A2283_21435 [Lentisphaerae bacterium RIFOXYA12_FULL_48_11]
MKTCVKIFSISLVLFSAMWINAASQRENTPPPPGTVIARSGDWEKQFLGSPSMEILSDGRYVFTHDDFTAHTDVYESKDRGRKWTRIGGFDRQRSGTLFAVKDILYQIGYAIPGVEGVSAECVAIRKSIDGGRTWTEPKDAKTGLILSDSIYYTDPVPVLFHNGRVWWQVDVVDKSKKGWAERFSMMVISASLDSDLLDAASWTRSNPVPWKQHEYFSGWVEGNVVADPDGKMHSIARVEDWKRPGGGGKTVARFNLSDDGKTLSFDPETGFINFPGGASKFCVRFDDVTKKYWVLTTDGFNGGARNRLNLVCSDDLKAWNVRSILYHHPDKLSGFQYCDWRIVGDDIHFVCRLGWYGKNFHDSNYMIFDTIKNFRKRTRNDDAEMLK